MKFYFTHNRKPLYKIKIWYKFQLNADELFYSNKKDAVKEWNKILKDSVPDIDQMVLVDIQNEDIIKEWPER